MTATVTVPVALNGTGTTYRDDDGANGMASLSGYGYLTYLFLMLSEVIAACQVAVDSAEAATNAANVNGTSTSSVATGSGSKTFTYAEADRTIVLGMWLNVASAADPGDSMTGYVTAWNSGTKAVTILVGASDFSGSGTNADWVISLSGRPGAPGSGDVTGPASAAADGNVALFDGLGGKTIKDGGTRAAWLAAGINGATGKTTPVDADELALIDSAASNVLKKLTWANLKATLKTYFDSLATTLTNKRITARVGSTTSSATPTINTDNVDIYRLTAQAADITSMTTNLSGAPNHGDTLVIEITGTGARAITWGTGFEASTVALPTTTVSTNMLQVSFLYNSATSKWRCVGSC
jgi:hypothetical protein